MHVNTKMEALPRSNADAVTKQTVKPDGTALDALNTEQLEQVSGGVWVREYVEDVEAY
jgi:hypothetical protein